MARRADNLHSRVIAWLKVILPLAALGIVAALFLTLRQIDPEEALTGAGIDVRGIARDVRIRNPDFSAMTADGTAIRLVAESARPDPARPGLVEAEAVVATLDPADGNRMTVSGDRAIISNAEDALTLSGNATIATASGYRLEGEAFVFGLSRTDLRSDGPVRAQTPFGEITADAMQLTQDAGGAGGHLLVFNGDVKLVYRPSY